MLPSDDPDLALDRQRLAAVRATRQEQAARYFAPQAPRWDQVRTLNLDEARIEAALLELFGAQPPKSLLDIGTGTGRILQLMAPRIGFGLGVDLSREMLAVARANLDRTSLRNCQVRYGDMYHLPLPGGSFDAATLHNVLRFADDPGAALAEAARVLRPGGRLVVVDLAPHRLELLREQHAHRRLGFADFEIAGMVRRGRARLRGAGPDPRRSAHRGDLAGAPPRRAASGISPKARPTADARSHEHSPPARPSSPLAPDLAPPAVALSFEFFPPKTAAAAERLWQTVEQLKPLAPHYVSVTCGAGGNPAEGTAALVDALRHEAGLCAAAHLTCASAPRAAIEAIARRYWDAGVRQLVALRGDRPKDAAPRPAETHHRFALDLVRALRRHRAISSSASPPIPRPIPRPRARPPISTISSASSMPAPAARSPSTASRPSACCAFATGWRPPASPPRSRSASCRCTTSRRSGASARAAAPACRTGSARCSRGSRTIPPSACGSAPGSPPSRPRGCSRRASASSTSTLSTAPSRRSPPAACSACEPSLAQAA